MPAWPLRAARPELVAGAASLVLGAVFAFRFAGINRGLGEIGLAALGLLYGAGLADPYLLMTGPTAHVSPVMAGLIAGIFGAAGIGTEGSRVLLGLAGALWYAAGALVAVRLLAEHDVAPRLRWIAAAVFVLLPFRLFDAVVMYWQYDQPPAALILATGWLAVVRVRKGSLAPRQGGVMLGLLAAAGALISPTTLPPILLGMAWLSWQRLRGALGPGWWAGAALGIVLVAAGLLGWGLRNERELGAFIVTRSNFGLELAQGNAPPEAVLPPGMSAEALGSRAQVEASIDRLAPLRNLAMARELARVGEVAFMRGMLHQALDWIRADIPGFLLRCLNRLRIWLLPPLEPDYVPVVGPVPPWLVNLALGVLTLPALLALTVLGRPVVEPVLFVLLPMAPYMITHVNPRYTYLVFFTTVALVLLAADAVLRRVARPAWLPEAVKREPALVLPRRPA